MSLFKLKNLIHFYLHVVKSIVIAPSTSTAAVQNPAELVVPQSSSGPTSGDASSTITSSSPAGDNSLVATLTGLHGLADKMFLNALNCQGNSYDIRLSYGGAWWALKRSVTAQIVP